jgi:hypothetical protein
MKEKLLMKTWEKNPLADLFPPIPQKFLEILHKYCDEEGVAASIIHGGVYLKRLHEMGILDLDGLCNEINYIFFVGKAAVNPDMFGEHNVSEIVDFIRANSALGGVLV